MRIVTADDLLIDTITDGKEKETSGEAPETVRKLVTIGSGYTKTEKGWYTNCVPYAKATYWDGLREGVCLASEAIVDPDTQHVRYVVGPDKVPLEDLLADIAAQEAKALEDSPGMHVNVDKAQAGFKEAAEGLGSRPAIIKMVD